MHAKITAFGGIFPALKPRALPGDAAQVNKNLLASVPDFRPLATDLNVAPTPGAINNPLTLYRLDRKADGSFNTDMTTGWVANAATVSYAKGPLNADDTERTYYSFDDGSAPPRWLDANGLDRQLGVPRPAAAPTVVVNSVAQFSVEDRTNAIEAAILQIVQYVRTKAAPVWVGGGAPGAAGTGATGYLNMQTGYSTPATQNKQARLWGISSYNNARNGAVSVLYGGAGTTDQYSWIFDPSLQPTWLPADATLPGWANVGAPGGSYRDNLAITFTAYGLGYDLDTGGLATLLAAIPMPGKSDGTKLLTADQITGADGIVPRLTAKLAHAPGGGTDGANKAQALAQAVEELRTLLNSGMQSALNAQYTAYYAKASTTTYIQGEIETWANRIFDTAAQVVASSIAAGNFEAGGNGAL